MSESSASTIAPSRPTALRRRSQDAEAAPRDGALGPAARHRQVAATVATAFGMFCLNALQGVLLARILGPAARGEYGTAVFYTQTLIYMGLLGTLYSIPRRIAQHPEQAAGLTRTTFRLAACTGLATMAVVAVLALVGLPSDKRQLLPLCLLASCMLPWEHLRLSLMAVDHGSADFRRYNISSLAGAGAFPALLVIVFLAGGARVPLIVALSVLAPILALVIRGTLREGKLPPAGESVPVRRVVREGLPYALADLSSHVFSRLDMFLVLWLMSFTVQGYFAAAVSAANLLIVTPNALALFTFNSGARRRATGPRQLLAAGAAVVLFQTATALAFAAVLGPLMLIVFGERFQDAIPLALALLPAYAVFGVSRVAVGYLRGRSRSTIEVRSRMLGAALMLLVVLLLFARFQEYSVPIAALCGNLLSTLYIAVGILRDARREQRAASLDPELGM